MGGHGLFGHEMDGHGRTWAIWGSMTDIVGEFSGGHGLFGVV